jgi:hypothetical protein
MNFKTTNNKALLTELIINNPDLTPKQIMQIFGLKKAFEEINPRELNIMFAKSNKRSFQRLLIDCEKVKLSSKETLFNTVRNSIEKFKPVNLKNF